jgi:16S rRNA (cytosine967-C5)-methyltransferase
MSVTAGRGASDARAAAAWRVFVRLANDLGAEAFRSGDFPNRIQRLIAGNRSFGSRDRRIYRELLHARCRAEPWASELAESTPGADLQLAAALSECDPAIAAASGLPEAWIMDLRAASWPDRLDFLRERWSSYAFNPDELAPAWLREECPEWRRLASPDLLWSRPPVWLRFQTQDPARRRAALAELARAGAECRPSGFLPEAFSTEARIDLTKLTCFACGDIEVQDLGSQMIVAVADPRPGESWLDACAGAGGKTLQLAARVGRGGRVAAEDPRAAALGELMNRCRRAGYPEVRASVVAHEPESWQPERLWDGVLVDAPCTGSGTWRRHPHLRFNTRASEVAEAAEVQLRLLEARSSGVRPGGQLVYATCSVCRSENEEVFRRFLQTRPEFCETTPPCVGPYSKSDYGIRIQPWLRDTDGFFVAVARRSGG